MVIAELTLEILLEIIKFLSLIEIAKIQRVSKLFLKITDRAFWLKKTNEIQIRFHKYNVDEIYYEIPENYPYTPMKFYSTILDNILYSANVSRELKYYILDLEMMELFLNS